MDDDEKFSKQKYMNAKAVAEQQKKVTVPVPAEKHNHCAVCNCYYEDYMTHIESSQHQH